jgi:hypothetical protein
MRLWPAALLVVLALLVATPVPTLAATVSVGKATGRFGNDFQVADYRASPGETNQLRMVRSKGSLDEDRLRVTDAGAPLASGPGCTALDAHTADCAATVDPETSDRTLYFDVRLGDGDDTAEAVVDTVTLDSAAGGNFDLWGDDGNDRLSIPPYNYYYGNLHGGPGNDVLHGLGFASEHTLDGGPGSDEVVGGRGNDRLLDGDPDGAAAPDTFDGGGGRFDVLSYEGAVRPLRVDLETERAGAVGEGDRVTGVEGVRGGDGNDVLRGAARAESLDGGGGHDFISGRGGVDDIVLNRGRAIGGPGADRIHIRGLATIACGADRDLVEELRRPGAGLYLARDCEQLHQGDKHYDTSTGIYVDPRARLRGDDLIRLTLRCGDCHAGHVRVTRAARPFRLLAQAAFRLGPTGTEESAGTATIGLPARVASLADRHTIRLRFILLHRGDHAVWTVRLGRSR